MATSRGTRIRPMNVVVAPGSPAEATYRRHRDEHAAAIEPGFPPLQQLDMHHFDGKSIQDMAYVNHFVGEPDAWDPNDIQRIETALAAAMTDTNLNNMLAQYFDGTPPTATPMARRQLSQTLAKDVYKNTIEGLVGDLHTSGALNGLDLTKTVVNFMLPTGSILHSGDSTGAQDAGDGGELDHEEEDSTRGLGGYHGSIHPSADETVYYAVGVYSQRNADGSENGIAVFDESWKNVVATFYHELQEARSDPDVGDVHTNADERMLGWYSLYPTYGGEIGDIPINEASGLGKPITTVFKEVNLTNGGTAPIQLMYSNVDHGPAEGSPTPVQPAG